MAKPFDATLNTLIDAHLSDWVGAEVYQNMSLTLEDSTTYQLILERGEAKGIAKGKAEGLAEGVSVGRNEEAQTLVLRLGTKRFGPPPRRTRSGRPSHHRPRAARTHRRAYPRRHQLGRPARDTMN